MKIKLCLVVLALVFCQNAKAEDLNAEFFLQIIHIKDGKILNKSFNVNDSAEYPVEGYINGVIMYSKHPCTPNLSDSNSEFNFQKADKGLGYFEKYLKEEMEFLDKNNIYGINSVIRAGPLSEDERINLTVDCNGKRYHLALLQSPPKKIIVNGIDIRIFGDFSLDDQFFKKAAAISRGVKNVRDIFGENICSHIDIIDYNHYDAQTIQGSNYFSLYKSLMEKATLEDLVVIAEHEVLHIVVDSGGMTRESQLREIFADLHELGELSPERFRLVVYGYFSLENKSKNEFFDLINEKSYLDYATGGHSADSLDEFCVSFLHTLMYPEIFLPYLELFPFKEVYQKIEIFFKKTI